MRVNRYIRNRKSPAFVGGSLYLDGVGDYIDMQGESSPAWWGSGKTEYTGNAMFRTASWMLWVKFPQTCISDVIAKQEVQQFDMQHFIIAEHGADLTETHNRWGGSFCGLVTDGNSNVQFAVGWGQQGSELVEKRVIRRFSSTNIVANTWYQIIWTNGAGRTANGAFTGWDTGITGWINNTSQTVTPYYGSFAGQNELTATSQQNYGYSSAHDPYATTYIGRKGDFYTEMYIAEAAYWDGAALDSNDVGTLYNSGTPLADILSNSGNYDKGSIVGAKRTFTFTGMGEGQIVTIQDFNGKSIDYKSSKQHYSGEKDGSYTYWDATVTSTTDYAIQFCKAVNHINGHGFPNKNLANSAGAHDAVQTIYATNNGPAVTLQLGTGGADGTGTAVITEGTSFANVTSNNEPDGWDGAVWNIVFTNSTAAFGAGNGNTAGEGSGTGVNSGLQGWWRFKGPSIDPNVSALHISSKRVTTVSGSNLDTGWHKSYKVAYHSQSMICQPAINNGGTYVQDTP